MKSVENIIQTFHKCTKHKLNVLCCYQEYLVKLFVLFEKKFINSASKYKNTFLQTHKLVAWT